MHKKQKDALAAAASPWRSDFARYRFTGSLRPFPVSPQRTAPDSIERPDYAVDGLPHSELKERGSNAIPIWSKESDVADMRRAGEIAREVTDLAAAALRPGITGDELDAIVHAACVERGVYPSPLNYHSFPKSVCVSVNEVICHGIPDARPLADGDIVNLDVTVYYKGFHSDMNETFCVGNVDETGRRLVRVAHACLSAAIAMCKPGVFYRALGDTITQIAHEAGFSVVKNYTGHGVGRLFHTAPNVPHYSHNKAIGIMQKGHVFTIEPVSGKCALPRGIRQPNPNFHSPIKSSPHLPLPCR
jgi:methionyl aminopeptidase